MSQTTGRPNIILCLCDELRAFEVGCYGNAHARTPHIDRLAQGGVRFEVAVSNNPVCMPARSLTVAGQYSRTCIGRLGNDAVHAGPGKFFMPQRPDDARPELLDPTLPECLQQAGYDTALVGKWHIKPAPRQLGFDWSLYPLTHHRHTGQTFIEETATERRESDPPGFSIDFEADAVRDYLSGKRGGRDADKPFFLFYNISPPHMPLGDMPDKYLTMFAPEDVPLRPNVIDAQGQLTRNEHQFKVYLWDFLFYQQALPHTLDLPEGFDLRHLTALYYGATTWVDDTVARMMSALEENGLAENTIVVFASDHGDHLGSRGQFGKGSLWEEATRIPFIVHAPGRYEPQSNTTQVASLLDLLPTLVSAAGAEVPATAQGQDLTPILRGTRGELAQSGAFIETTGGLVGLRTPTHLYGVKLSPDKRQIEGDWGFYDLQTDPLQERNLAVTKEQATLGAALHKQVVTWAQHTPWLKVSGSALTKIDARQGARF